MNKTINLFKTKKTLDNFCQKNQINYLGVFGSYARGEEKPKSDLDFLVDFKKTISLFDLINLKLRLEKRFGRKVDLVSKNYIKPLLKPYINKDLVTLYEKK